MATKEEINRAIAGAHQGPKSICQCGHLGDGTGKTKEGRTNMHAGALGHGYCLLHAECRCEKFRFKDFIPELKKKFRI